MHFFKIKNKRKLLKTKIVATLGPEGRDLFDKDEILQEKVSYRQLFVWLYEELEGFPIDVIRLNMSFYPNNKKDCEEIFSRFIVEHKKRLTNVAILGDLPGAKPRLGPIPTNNKEIELIKGQPFKLYLTEKRNGDKNGASVLAYGEPLGDLSNYQEIYGKLRKQFTGFNPPGIEISIADGAVVLVAIKESQGILDCIVKKEGTAKENKGVTFHQIDLGLPSFEKNDKEVLKFLLDIDSGEGILAYVAISFVRLRIGVRHN